MVKSYKVRVVLPAYNAAETLKKTYSEIPLDIVDEIILVDDASTDKTIEVAKEVSSINFLQSMYYGLGVVLVSLKSFLHRSGIVKFKMYRKINGSPIKSELSFNKK